MTEHGDRLREAFITHENQTPDPAAVYARVEELARKHKWRRRSAQAAGGVALSAGLIAGITQMPGFLPGEAAPSGPVIEVAAPSATPSYTDDQAFDAYFEAGFGYTNALELAKLWNMTDTQAGDIKLLAGRKLLAGETLPVQPKPNTEGVPGQTEDGRNSEAFFNGGYDWDDAVKLAKLWKLDDPYQAKIEGGKRLLAGETLPIKPDPKQLEEARKSKLATIFWEAGYDGEDAAKLAKLWKMDSNDTYAVKVEAGRRLEAGETLPIKP
ncbi:hypothetical protein KZ829_11205 [Actinoplanes hulinensis]|uniref:LysM domain-containing protein n=1 Tax=Actinoplanes hulinensis TaxID=1144547 RepID=A0ABS7B0I0_9ACTN|nr:hypothetical protein [Actinoplanes hulinensis]MBW6434299.1 hypothetical protein [Actinoplanes hulinensis]